MPAQEEESLASKGFGEITIPAAVDLVQRLFMWQGGQKVCAQVYAGTIAVDAVGRVWRNPFRTDMTETGYADRTAMYQDAVETIGHWVIHR